MVIVNNKWKDPNKWSTIVMTKENKKFCSMVLTK
jgi:hypothetical protein